jgi:hypothetical protein
MRRPKPNRAYFFVRVVDGNIECAEFMHFRDGSVALLCIGMALDAEDDPEAWKKTLDSLVAEGFVELEEARQARLVPDEWEPQRQLPDVSY